MQDDGSRKRDQKQQKPPPRTTSRVSQPAVPVTPPPRTRSGTGIPRTTSTPGLLAKQLGSVENASQAQKEILQSAFADDDEVTQFDALLGQRPRHPPPDEDEHTNVGHTFDGETPAQGVGGRDLFKAITPPLQSREGRRSGALYEQILNQFAVGKNPRYDEDAPGKPRGHIFVWDVTRAMGAEIPHFLGARELSLGLTVDWLRHEGPMRGWRRCSDEEALAAANEGHPVVVVPKEVRIKHMGMVRPGKMNFDGNPFICAVANARGNRLSLNQAFGVFAAEYFLHP